MSKLNQFAGLAVRSSVAAVLGTAIASSITPVASAAAAADEPLAELEEVQVTGTRIRREDYISPNPVQTLDAEQLEQMGIVNLGDALAQIPVNVSSFQPANQGGNPFFVGSTLANLRGLNPYFGTRTLTLVDSRRFVPTNQGQSVDLNFIPTVLVQRMETVTGGASAAYGSDAVSGVVNIILDKRLDGWKFDGSLGMTEEGDGENQNFGVAFGTDLFEGRGHLVLGGEYQNSESIDDCSAARRWCGRSLGLLQNGGGPFDVEGSPYAPVDPSRPYRFRAQDLRVNQVNQYGVIYNGAPGAGTAISADAAGTGTGSFAIGQYGDLSPTQTVIGGDGVPTTAITSLYPEIERKTAFGHLSFDLTDSMQGFVEASFGNVDGFVTQGGPGFVLTSYCVRPDNAYLTGDLGAAVLGAAGNDDRAPPPFGAGCLPDQTLVRKDWYSQIDRRVTTDTKTWRGVAGLNGQMGSSGWSWDAYYQFGRTRRTQILYDNNTSKRMDMALDAVLDGGGNAVCRVTRDGVQAPPGGVIDPARVALAEGCVPLSLFGNQPLTDAQRNYAFGELFEQNVIKQNVLALNVSGPLWDGWGYGPLSAAAGVEYRHEKLTNEAADLPFYQRTDFAAQYGDPFAGTTQVREGFVELEMPLLAGVRFAETLQLNAAARRTSYKTEDDLVATNPDTKVDVTTWKLAGVWDPVGWLRIRGSRSRDLRAAGFRELYYSQSIPADPPGTGFGFGGATNPWLPDGPFGDPFDPAVVVLSGNSSLRPEKATTTTAGFVLSPGGNAEGMHFSIDWYRIKLVNGISGGLIQRTISNCYNGDAFYCSLIEGTAGVAGTPGDPGVTVPGPDGSQGFFDITALRAPYENGRPYRAEGLDITWDYATPVDRFFSSGAGRVFLRASVTNALKTQLEYLEYPNYEVRDVVGQVGSAGFLADYAPTPKWVGTFSATYSLAPVTVTLLSQWTGSGKLNNEVPWTGPDDPDYDPALVGSVDDNTVGNYFVFGLNASVDLPLGNAKSSQLYVSINNLLGRDPPFSNGGIGGVNGVFYDTLGRTYRAGVRLRF
ncbi:MAG TPA: TonB-dependent receptor [Steroidobacteraceae bacterium]|nr:TonB-dependent receptor [Steroidobacteraceae bacterium]